LELLAAVTRKTLSVVTRLRLDAALYKPAPARNAGSPGRPRKQGQRLPTLAQVAADPTPCWQRVTVALWYGEVNGTVEITSATAVWFHSGMPPVVWRWVLSRAPAGQFKTPGVLCTNPQAAATDIGQWFVQRRPLEVTVEEVRAHLGVETQRQWSTRAIARTTALLLALFSLMTLIADRMVATRAMPVRTRAWYRKAQPTFSDAVALVRPQWWAAEVFSMSRSEADVEKIPPPVLERLTEALCYAA
jgi:hypothetical protein